MAIFLKKTFVYEGGLEDEILSTYKSGGWITNRILVFIILFAISVFNTVINKLILLTF